MSELVEYKFESIYKFIDIIHQSVKSEVEFWGYNKEEFIESAVKFSKNLCYTSIYKVLYFSTLKEILIKMETVLKRKICRFGYLFLTAIMSFVAIKNTIAIIMILLLNGLYPIKIVYGIYLV